MPPFHHPRHAPLSALQSQAVAGGGQSIGGLVAGDWHVAAGKTGVDPTTGAQVTRADPRRKSLEIRQEGVDVDVDQFVGLVGVNGAIDRVAAEKSGNPSRTVSRGRSFPNPNAQPECISERNLPNPNT